MLVGPRGLFPGPAMESTYCLKILPIARARGSSKGPPAGTEGVSLGCLRVLPCTPAGDALCCARSGLVGACSWGHVLCGGRRELRVYVCVCVRVRIPLHERGMVPWVCLLGMRVCGSR